ncbi:hypothetical protein NEOLEDRAFT_1126496, partial [Neolentinus lepideus HHB14362 ss-1]
MSRRSLPKPSLHWRCAHCSTFRVAALCSVRNERQPNGRACLRNWFHAAQNGNTRRYDMNYKTGNGFVVKLEAVIHNICQRSRLYIVCVHRISELTGTELCPHAATARGERVQNGILRNIDKLKLSRTSAKFLSGRPTTG